jgi:hypothetical protein
VYIPGANVPSNNYTLPLASIQASTASSANLFVSILSYGSGNGGKCISSCPFPGYCYKLHDQVQAAIASATAAGFSGDASSDIYLGAHSLGGTCTNHLVQAYPDEPEYHNAVILHGAYVDEVGDYSLANFPAKLLMLGAELDGGLARPGKMANWVYEMQVRQTTLPTRPPLPSFLRFSDRNPNSPPPQELIAADQDSPESASDVIRQHGALIIPGIDHSDFCPGFEVPGDIIPSDLDQPEATAAVADATAAWLKYSLFDSAEKEDVDHLKDLYERARGRASERASEGATRPRRRRALQLVHSAVDAIFLPFVCHSLRERATRPRQVLQLVHGAVDEIFLPCVCHSRATRPRRVLQLVHGAADEIFLPFVCHSLRSRIRFS